MSRSQRCARRTHPILFRIGVRSDLAKKILFRSETASCPDPIPIASVSNTVATAVTSPLPGKSLQLKHGSRRLPLVGSESGWCPPNIASRLSSPNASREQATSPPEVQHDDPAQA